MTSRPIDALERAISALDENKAALAGLAAKVEVVTKLVGVIDDTQHRQRNTTRWLIGFFGLMVITIGLVVNNAVHVQGLQDRTSSGVLCPVFGQFYKIIYDENGDRRKPDPASVATKEQRATYEEFAVSIRHAVDVLDCDAQYLQ